MRRAGPALQPAPLCNRQSVYALSAYDAEYLEPAAREALPLATVDKQLRGAAIAAGVKLV
jgi:predicted nucleic acid-binding protein